MPFSVTCPSCGKSFQLAQEIYERKVAGKVVSIKCKQCQSGIRIDATEPGGLKVIGSTPAGAAEAPAPTGAQAARARQATLIGMMGPSGKPVTTGASDAGALWAVDAGGTGEDRELDDAAIAREIAAGAVTAQTLVWRDGMGDWLEVSKIPELAKHLPSAKKPEPAKVAAPLPAARAKQPSAPGIAAPAPAPAVKAAAPLVNPAPAVKAAAPVAKAPAPAAPVVKAPAPAAPAARAPAAPAIPSMVSEDDDEEATMIFRSSAEAVAKLGLDVPSDEESSPGAPRPAAGRAAVAAPLPAAGRAAATAKAPSAPRNPAPAAKAPSAPLNPAPAVKAPSAPLNPTPTAKAPSAPLNPAPTAKAPSAPLNPAPAASPPAPPPLPAAATPLPSPPAPAAAPPAPPPPPRAKQPSAPVLPRGLTAPPEPQPPPSPPPPPAEDAPAAALPPVRPRQQSAPVWPRGLTPPPDRPNPLGGAPTPPPTAPPFVPTQNPFAGGGAAPGQMAQLAPNPFAVATTTDLEYAPPRSKMPLVIGGIVALVAAAGVAFAVLGSGSHPPPPPVPAAPPTPPPQTLTPPPQADTQAAETSTPPAHPSDDIAGTPRPSPGASGDFSQMFAAGAEKAQKGGSTGSAKAFDAEDAKTAVAAVLKLVAACKEPGGPTGQSAAAVTFDASGHVSSVTVGAPFSGTSTGTCIIGAFKNAKMPPFSGLPGTISQPVSLL